MSITRKIVVKHQLIIAEGNSHMIQKENPELVLNAIVQMADLVKNAK